MEYKLLEIRDRGTSIPALAIEISGKDGYLAKRAGFEGQCIYLLKLATQEAKYDAYDWDMRAGRTMRFAHQFIIRDWNDLKSEDVIDVEFMLGETDTPKVSERHGK